MLNLVDTHACTWLKQSGAQDILRQEVALSVHDMRWMGVAVDQAGNPQSFHTCNYVMAGDDTRPNLSIGRRGVEGRIPHHARERTSGPHCAGTEKL